LRRDRIGSEPLDFGHVIGANESCASPPVRKKLTGLPSASTKVWIC
jgi:hypothetical protein